MKAMLGTENELTAITEMELELSITLETEVIVAAVKNRWQLNRTSCIMLLKVNKRVILHNSNLIWDDTDKFYLCVHWLFTFSSEWKCADSSNTDCGRVE